MIVEKSTEWLILISVVFVVVFSYVLAWRGKQVAVRRIGSLVGAAICTMAARVATMGYGMPALGDFGDHRGDIGNAVIVWIICIGAWVAAVRFGFLLPEVVLYNAGTRTV